MARLETELEQSRLREMETLGALREMQDKVLDMEKVQLGRPVFGTLGGRGGGVLHALKGVHIRPEPRKRGCLGNHGE